jgi:hypothetical protein
MAGCCGGGGGGGYSGSSYQVSESGSLGRYFETSKAADNPSNPGGSFVSFGSKEDDGYHKTTIVYDACGDVIDTPKSGGGAFAGGFWNWAASKVTGR